MLVHQFGSAGSEESVQELRELGSKGGTRGFFLTKSGQDSTADVLEIVNSEERDLSFVVFLGFDGSYDLIEAVAADRPYLFCVLVDPTACGEPKVRLDLFAAGVNMVASDLSELPKVVGKIESFGTGEGGKKTYTCPVCGTRGLAVFDLVEHHMTYHMAQSHRGIRNCPICGQGVRGELGRHLHKVHAEHKPPPKAPFAAFSWIVCYNPETQKFLMTNEKAESAGGVPGYWLPGKHSLVS